MQPASNQAATAFTLQPQRLEQGSQTDSISDASQPIAAILGKFPTMFGAPDLHTERFFEDGETDGALRREDRLGRLGNSLGYGRRCFWLDFLWCRCDRHRHNRRCRFGAGSGLGWTLFLR